MYAVGGGLELPPATSTTGPVTGLPAVGTLSAPAASLSYAMLPPPATASACDGPRY